MTSDVHSELVLLYMITGRCSEFVLVCSPKVRLRLKCELFRRFVYTVVGLKIDFCKLKLRLQISFD